MWESAHVRVWVAKLTSLWQSYRKRAPKSLLFCQCMQWQSHQLNSLKYWSSNGIFCIFCVGVHLLQLRFNVFFKCFQIVVHTVSRWRHWCNLPQWNLWWRYRNLISHTGLLCIYNHFSWHRHTDYKYSRLLITRTFKGNWKKFELLGTQSK